ncbi:non-heme iron oxygenase ferredoxin subunit [Xylophilus sp. GOD-11R]|uniref:non-heme iron oxygenase ferredoxin subunit n=1 Tax=Xylophilus sp. GOD-11R TaxID=3089814 RepID=UPI00298D27BB|nr:non-heme iron oxygenase ferredoxin subunit [Xylophilus sp. GOD-11R]WPB57164.1 non-heme iron oxygenase ferredoxin subunit [Xylophilus sp. GOD-11R]
MTWHPIAKTDEVDAGESLQVKVGDDPIAIYNLDGTFYATHDICTHAHAHLSDGYIDGDCIECPLHAGVFHIPTGKAMSGPVQRSIRIYPCRVEGETVLVET